MTDITKKLRKIFEKEAGLDKKRLIRITDQIYKNESVKLND
jgi:hypothetical protein